MDKSIVPLNEASEAFNLFSQSLMPFVVDVRLEIVRFDIGDYVHLIKSFDRLVRIKWIRETITNPDYIRKSYYSSQPFREIYIKKIYKDRFDDEGESFIVCVDRKHGGWDFRTAFVARETYQIKLTQGKLIWKKRSK